MLLQLSLYVLTVIQMTSSQSTNGVTQPENDVTSCGRTDQVLNQMVEITSQLQTAVSQIQTTVSQLQTSVSQLRVDNSQPQRDVAEIKATTVPRNITGVLSNQKSTPESAQIVH